ncbi:helix-turn-helix domain-containing protein [Sphingomonas arenae]|uniref:helix-turn-helix domain-containing protein n=1 Tax=Sphingomonas arenae TaxID=2812555 RepID=UPI001967ECEC|nr:helix-turn-helix domain-containing protein [Sphingomonas arenae]
MATSAAAVLPALPATHPCHGCAARELALCGVLQEGELATFKSLGGHQQMSPGQPLFHEGDPTTQVFNITRGSLKIYKLLPDGRRQVMGFMFPGDFLGISISDEHAFTAEALEPTHMCRFARNRFDDFVEERPDMERRLYSLAAHELAAAQAQMVLLGRKSAAERLASFFLDLAQRAERLGRAPVTAIDLPMSRLDIADYLGLTKETVSRVLAQLKQKRLIRLVTLNRIEILDREGLDAIAQGLTDN